MLKRVNTDDLNDYFLELNGRKSRGVFFYRINGYNKTIHEFIQRYYEAARRCGVIIEGRLQNPDSNNLAYYGEIMGMSFRLDLGFITSSLQKWLPRMSPTQRRNVAEAMYDTLIGLKRAGKNDNMLKNAYIKFMCWLYYRFERIVNQLGNQQLPKILYEGNISNYELLMMSVLSIAGCDIVLLQYQGDAAYKRIDPDSARSSDFQMMGMTAFPQTFSLKQIRTDIQNALDNDRLYGAKPKYVNCTNAWITGKILEDVQADVTSRGSEANMFYNCFCRIMGVEDKLTYQNDLYQLQLELKNAQRRIVIVNKEIAAPTNAEINEIRRGNYRDVNQLILGLSTNIPRTSNQELQRLMHKAFVDVMLAESKKGEMNVNRLMNKGVYILCWLRRYHSKLFGGWQIPQISCFFYMGGCRNANEALFCSLLARLPVDVLIFCPNLNQKCCLDDKLLYEVHNSVSMLVSVYPEENTGMRIGTAAYHAERDLDSLMYTDTGMFRNQQYGRANSVTLRTMYEEISLLWDQELKYRPSFGTVDDVVTMPVIFSKVSGVKNSNLQAYWSGIKDLLTSDTKLICKVPQITSTSPNPIKPFATEFYRGGRLQRERIKSHRAYQYGFLRKSMQEHLLDKLDLLINQKLIRGTFQNGTEYTIISTVLNIDKRTLRSIQSFDFTKKNPKLVYVITREDVLSLEDTIYVTFLNLVGFDIMFFVPTGYQCVGQHLNRNIIEEHQIGEYVYDLQVPDFDTIWPSSRSSWRDRLFRRGV